MSKAFHYTPLTTIELLQGVFYDDFLNSSDIPLLRPAVSRKAIAEIHRVFSSGWIGEGEEVYRFEAELAEMLGVQHVVTVNSGTSAIDLAIELLHLKAGDTVISTPLTCAATNIPLLRRGIRIQWADIDARCAVLSCPPPRSLPTLMNIRKPRLDDRHLLMCNQMPPQSLSMLPFMVRDQATLTNS
ncbi:MAG: DegT/DnrJ/EryC1/StrS family aminotransferase [Burkholderiales bacterium]|nr:DegT/DnrJ/EryC1/StrS family aminotransferase [Burkholderiales bacterium]